jgi:peptidoglycan/LPS O-acetylase OafA/YrhL
MKFRQDINGLRAFAVIAVVLFHFKANLLTGGFSGVDGKRQAISTFH